MSTKFLEILGEVNSDYIFLDLPYYSNIGDTLIWKGTEEMLSKTHHKCLLRASCQTFQFQTIDESIVILLQGGGNWGDLYSPHNIFRKKVVESYPNNRIIILPQTIYYEGARNARADAAVFRKHKHLTICVRDKYSYRFLKTFRFGNDIRLMPDMAFCIDKEELTQMSLPSIHKDLIFKRIDKERTSVESYMMLSENYDVSDWPFYEEKDEQMEHLEALIKEEKWSEADEYAVKVYMPQRVRTGVELISRYDKVISNRLHGAILAALLGKEVYIVDNSYGKNSQYYNAWLKDMPNVHLVSTSRTCNIKRTCRFCYQWFRGVIDYLIH